MPAKTKNASSSSQLSRFMRKRLDETLGILLIGLAASMVIALFTYDPLDPSLNTARAAGNIHNYIGPIGAYFADIFLQAFGLASYLLPLVLTGWGVHLFKHQKFEAMPGRLLALIIGVLTAAYMLSIIPCPHAWHMHTGLGGAAGDVFLTFTYNALHPLIGQATKPLIGLTAFAATFALITVSTFLSMRQVLRNLSTLLVFIATLIWTPFHSLWKAFRTPKNQDFIEPKKIKRQKKAPTEPPLYTEEEIPPFDDPMDQQPEMSSARIAMPSAASAPPKTSPKRAAPVKKGDYHIPDTDLIHQPKNQDTQKVDHDSLAQTATALEAVLQDFGVKGEIVKVHPGPVVTLYELIPSPGTKSSRVISLSDDIARSLSATSVRIAVIPGKNAIGIELPNDTRQTVYMREMLDATSYHDSPAKLPLIMGKNIGGEPIVVDLARMPHLLMAGTTGSGKSVAINTMILSLLFRYTPQECRLIMVDPKMLELSVYEGIPHLLAPVVTDPKKAIVALRWAVREMENRYKAMSKLGVRNIEGYNARIAEAEASGEDLKRQVQTGFDAETGQPTYEEEELSFEKLPYIVVIVDELADLMLVAGKEIEGAIQRLAQMARAAGIHLIVATQRPSVDVITGTIKANFPTRVSFMVTSKIDSRTILGEGGAENLLGQGDMLYMAGGGRITRIHGPFVKDQDVEKVVTYLKKQGSPQYVEAVTEADDENNPFEAPSGGKSGDELYDRAVAVVLKHKKASTSFVQRQLQLGYNRAANLIERMESEGLISAPNHAGKREILGGSDFE